MASMTPSPNKPSVHLLTISLEIRREIIFYALLYPHGVFDSPRNIVEFSWSSYIREYYHSNQHFATEEFWGTKQMTAIFLTNRKLHVEAEDMLYRSGRFTFLWPRYTCPCSIDLFLSKRPGGIRGSIKSIQIQMAQLLSASEAERISYERKNTAIHGTMMKEMPGLKEVRLDLDFVDSALSGEESGAVDSVVSLAGAFRGVEKVLLFRRVVHNAKDGAMIAKQAVERIEGRLWTSDAREDSEYLCCSGEEKKRLLLDII